DQSGDAGHGTTPPSRRSTSPDLRLYGFAGGAWAAAIAVLFTGTAAGVWLASAAAAVAVAASLALVRRRSPPWWGWVAVGVVLGVVTGAAATAGRTATRDADPLATLARDRVRAEVEIRITDDPRPVRSRQAGPPA